MLGTELADLATLARNPGTFEGVVSASKTVAPELWSPAGTVIQTGLARNISNGNFYRSVPEGEFENIRITPRGRARLHELLLMETSHLGALSSQTMEAVQFCCHDSADNKTAVRVLARLVGRFEQRIKTIEDRIRANPRTAGFTVWCS
jgi:hypothetical protein